MGDVPPTVLTHSLSKLPVAMFPPAPAAIAMAIPAASPFLRPLPLATEPPSLLEFSGLSESSAGAGGRPHGPVTLGSDPLVPRCCCWSICGWGGVDVAEVPDPGGGAGKRCPRIGAEGIEVAAPPASSLVEEGRAVGYTEPGQGAICCGCCCPDGTMGIEACLAVDAAPPPPPPPPPLSSLSSLTACWAGLAAAVQVGALVFRMLM